MASLAFIESTLNRLRAEDRPALKEAFKEAVTTLRFGRATSGEAAENFAGSFLEGETHSVAGTEFSIAHGRDGAPYLAVPVLDLQAVGARIVPLEVTKAADNRRVYLKSTVASAPFILYLE